MTEKEIKAKYNISSRTLLYYRKGGKVKNNNKNKNEYMLDPILTQGFDWDIYLINNRSVVIYSAEGISKILSKKGIV